MKNRSLEKKIILSVFYNDIHTITRWITSVIVWSWNLVKRDPFQESLSYFNFYFKYLIETPNLLFVIEMLNNRYL